ncbi:MAG: LysM peptidoglycan-binding domain-containing protein [Rubrivivax sp.]|nr:MAG: LysM peptidoglycan-binding domain-containing protein [Rubrivivax sp.]
MIAFHPSPALRRSFRTFITLASLAALSACSSLPNEWQSSLVGNKPVAATSKTGANLLGAAAAGNAEALAIEANRSNEPGLITRPLPVDALKADKSSTGQQGDEEGRTAVGKPTDPFRPELSLNLDDAEANKDLWARLRKGFALPELNSELVADHERWYSTRPDYVQRMTERANRYLFHVVEEIERRQMPTELALLPFIESAFNPQAMSSARASGIWQFMPATGKDFELTQNLFRDDRRDVLASTRAALDYLQRLHRLFGDWHLALAAYNWGEGNVQRAIKRNEKAGLPTDYLSLNMPDETRHYLPKLHAVRNIVARPDSFGLSLMPIENHPYFVSVPIQRDMDVAVAARLAQIPLQDFQALNPSMNKPVILAAGTPQVLLPYDNASQFIHNLHRHRGPLATWTAWVVPKTMRPAEAARQVGMSETELRSLNKIPARMLVKSGSTLLVPRPHQREQDVSESVADNAMMSLAPDLPPMRRLTVKAGKRDTVASIAKRYKVTPAQVAGWNKVGTSAKFKRAQAIVVYVPVKAGKGRAMAASRHTSDDDGNKASKRGGKQQRKAVASSDKAGKGRTTAAASGKSRQAAAKLTARAKVRAQAPSRQSNKLRVAGAP